MRVVAIAAVIAIALGAPDLAAAQSAAPAPKAPVGHRQPTTKDTTAPASPPVAASKEDRTLERALKGICRGC
jgi:hypothetical protein